MNRNQLPDMPGANGVTTNMPSLTRGPPTNVNVTVGGPAPPGASVPSIPSLKRTLSGGSGSGLGHHAPGTSQLSSITSITSVLQQPTPSTSPPQMLRATTSTGVFNRPMPNSARPGTTTMPTATRSVTQTTMQDWRMYMTIEERQAVRSKIRDAYTSRCPTYDELLQVASAIEEELLHISAPSRLDYFKSGFEFENRVKLKKDQLQGQLAALDAKRRGSSSPKGSDPSGSPSSHDAGAYSKKQRT